MQIDKKTAACVSGYRPEKFSFSLSEANSELAFLQERLDRAVHEAIIQGTRTFLCGMAQGFDLLAGEVVLKHKLRSIDKISLIAVAPYENQHKSWNSFWQGKYIRLANQADFLLFMQPFYTPFCFHQRNRFMVQHSQMLICYYNGQEGGTMQTVELARRQGMQIVNLADIRQL